MSHHAEVLQMTIVAVGLVGASPVTRRVRDDLRELGLRV